MIYQLIVLLFLIVISVLCYLIYKKVSISQSCVGVPNFNGGTYVKKITIPIINKVIDVTANCKTDGSLDINATVDGTVYDYPNNKWIYDKDSCKLIISLSSDLQGDVNTYANLDNEIVHNKDDSMTINAVIMNVIPLSVNLTKS